MTISTDLQDFAEQWVFTNYDALFLKRKTRLLEDGGNFGRLSVPQLKPREHSGTVGNDEQLAEAVKDLQQVVVIGHGNLANGERFVWRGTGKEFNETWRGD